MKIKINTENAAFESFREGEIARILRQIAHDVETGNLKMSYNDINGNRVCWIEEI